jgi:small subunit ribosomal protein S21
MMALGEADCARFGGGRQTLKLRLSLQIRDLTEAGWTPQRTIFILLRSAGLSAAIPLPCPRRSGTRMVKLTVRERESIQEAVRRFRKLVERSGIKKEMRRREFFEKPSETKRRARLRAERRTKRNRLLGVV